MGVTGTWSLTTTAYAQDSITGYAAEAVRAQVTPIVIGVLAAILACVAYDLVKKLNWSWTPQGVAMAVIDNRRRKQYIRFLAAFLITEAFEEALYKERWTREEVNEMYKIIGSRCGMKDLVPKSPIDRYLTFKQIEELKEAIRKRINRKKPPSIKSILFSK